MSHSVRTDVSRKVGTVTAMGSPVPLRERKRTQTRSRIVEAAVALFTERGFEATTADDIAAAAECSRSTLFRYFGTKEDILFGDVLTRIATLRDELATRHPCTDPWTVAKQVGMASLVDFFSEPSQLPRACIDLWFSHPTPLCRYLEITHQWEQLLAEFFAAERGTEPAVDLHSQLLASTMVGAVRAVMRAYSIPGADLHAAIDEAFGLLERGFGGRPAPA